MVVRRRLEIEGPALAFVTTTVTGWRPIFADAEVANAVLSQLNEVLEQFRVALIGYVLMPSHFHALLGFPQIEKLSAFMQAFKSLSSRRIKALNPGGVVQQFGESSEFRLWRPRFDDLIIVSEKQFRTKLKYIHENPIRAGLTKVAQEWPYSSAADWLDDSPGLLPVEKTWKWID